MLWPGQAECLQSKEVITSAKQKTDKQDVYLGKSREVYVRQWVRPLNTGSPTGWPVEADRHKHRLAILLQSYVHLARHLVALCDANKSSSSHPDRANRTPMIYVQLSINSSSDRYFNRDRVTYIQAQCEKQKAILMFRLINKAMYFYLFINKFYIIQLS